MLLWLYTWQERNAATLGPLNLHREWERTNGTNRPHICISAAPISTDEGRAGPPRQRERTAGRTADPPPILQTANVSGPERIHPQQHQHKQSRTTGGQEDRRTGGQEDRRTGGQEDRQTPSTAKDPHHLDPVKHLDRGTESSRHTSRRDAKREEQEEQEKQQELIYGNYWRRI